MNSYKGFDKKISEAGEPHPKTIAVIFGGCSPEYDVSLQSAYAVISYMNREKFQPVLVGISRQGSWYHYNGSIHKIVEDTWCNEDDCVPVLINGNRQDKALITRTNHGIKEIHIDAAFPVLHGKNGEDGTAQGIFEMAGIPVVGCGVLASALCMDKDRAHKLVQSAGIPVPESYVLEKDMEVETAISYAEKVGYPLFVKPVKAGSSFGVTKVMGRNTFAPAIKKAFQYDDRVLVEENIEGLEIGCAVIGKDELTVGEVDEIELSGGFFDYSEKYARKTSRTHVPARIEKEVSEQAKNMAKKIYKILDCSGFARVDMFLSSSGRMVFHEVNTIPGFTAHSRFPNMLKAAGMPFGQIVSAVIEMAVRV